MKDEFLIWAAHLDRKKNYCVLEDLDNVDDDFELKKGIPRQHDFPDNAVYNMDPEYPRNVVLADNLFNINRMIVASGVLKRFVEERSPANMEYLPVTIMNHKGRVASRDYFILHPVHPQDGLDADASGAVWSDFIDDEIDEVERLVIDASKIPREIQLLRLKYYPDPILVRRNLAEAISNEGFTGIRWITLDQYPEG